MYKSFDWFLYCSGGFMQALAKVVQLADDENLKKLEAIYPEIVTAYKMHDHSVTPPEMKYETRLVGDIKQNMADHLLKMQFLESLEKLMEEYHIDKINVGWRGPWNVKEND